MPSEIKLEDVQQALMDALNGKLKGHGIEVEAITNKNFDKDGNLITNPPAALLMFAGEDLVPLRDSTRKNYADKQKWLLFCGANNFQSTNAEIQEAAALVTLCKETLAGLVLTLADTYTTEPITIENVALQQFDADGSWYSLGFCVGGVAQFS